MTHAKSRALQVRISDSVTVLEPRDSTSSTPSTATSTPILKRRKLDEIHQKVRSADTCAGAGIGHVRMC